MRLTYCFYLCTVIRPIDSEFLTSVETDSLNACWTEGMTFILGADGQPFAVSFVRNDNATGLAGGYTNYVYEFV